MISLHALNTARVSHTLNPTSVILTAFGESKIRPVGTTVVACEHKGRKWHVRFYVTKEDTAAILGQNACEKMGLVKRVHAVETAIPLTRDKFLELYADVFRGLGQYKNEYHIETKPGVTPSVQPARRVLYAKYEKLKDTLEQLEKRGIIAKVDRPTDWGQQFGYHRKKRMGACASAWTRSP